MSYKAGFLPGATGILLVLAHPGDVLGAVVPGPVRSAEMTMGGGNLLNHIKVLASDPFEGRAPGSSGEEKTVEYLIQQFQGLGLQPGNPDGSWTQKVPMVGTTAEDVSVSYETGGRKVSLAFPEECVIWSKRQLPEVTVDASELVFVGYGVVAPEYKWDDYKDVDVRGKTILMLINDPQVPDPKNSDQLDSTMFKGRAMTYYGRWTYKFEIAAEKGAAAAIIVHEEGPAGYPWAVVQGSNSRENFDLQQPDKNQNRTAIEGWITSAQARKLCGVAGFDFNALKTKAITKEFQPISLGVKTSFALKNRLRSVVSQNVVARLEGSSRKLRNDCVIYTAHWDHLGRDPKLSGDQIYHGALDNASGVAGLLELASAYRKLSTPPKRSILFLSVTAEEKGLLGSRYYAAHPLYPLAQTAANLNMDGLNPWGRTLDVQIIGAGQSSLEEILERSIADQGRKIIPEPHPERGYFFRSDHFEFAKVGVPALYFKAGTNFIGKPPDYGPKKIEEYVRQDYHKVTDNVKPDWDFSGAIEDLRLMFEVGWTVAEMEKTPVWKSESEFKNRREIRATTAGR
jgi:Zn-dependent M28 family amino/carboxypeptidase